MVFPGHIAGGYLVTRALLTLAQPDLTTHQAGIIYFIGMLASVAPDADLLAFFFEHNGSNSGNSTGSKKTATHRDYISHAPVVWAAIGIVIAALGWVFGSGTVQFAGWAVWAGSWTHFALDSIEYGVMWLWPISTKRFYIRRIEEKPLKSRPGTFSSYYEFVTAHYWKTVTCYAEILITVAAVLAVLKVI